MKLDKLVKMFRRDLTANPLKAGVLGVLLLGAMYFWGPLVWKWVGKKGTAAADVAVVPSTGQLSAGGPSAGVLPTGSAGGNKETELAWREVRDRRKTDPLARSADFRPQWSQIFQVANTAATAAKPEAVGHATIQAEAEPKDLGLVLQGVAIGPQVKKAIISGKVYREQDSIAIRQKSDATSPEDDQQPGVVFRLVRVDRKMVVLERGGKFWQLKLASVTDERQQPTEVSQAQQDQDDPGDEKVMTPDEIKAATAKE